MIRNDTSGTLATNYRHKMKYRHNPWHRHETKTQGIRNKASIHERPKEVDSSQFGDWEMDTIVGRGNHGAIVTLIERSTNFLVMEKLKHGVRRPRRWIRRYGGGGHTWESISRQSQRITEANLQIMSGLHIGWHWISISRMHTLHGRKELSRAPTSLSGSILQKEQI